MHQTRRVRIQIECALHSCNNYNYDDGDGDGDGGIKIGTMMMRYSCIVNDDFCLSSIWESSMATTSITIEYYSQ